MLRTTPFEPFRIRLSDGVSFDIRHPDMAIVQSKVMVAVTGSEGPGLAERTVNCAPVHITRTEALNGARRNCP